MTTKGMKICDLFEEVATLHQKFVVVWRLVGEPQLQTSYHDSYMEAEDYLCTLPVARDCEYKFICCPEDLPSSPPAGQKSTGVD